MTQKELHNQRLVNEAERAVMRMHTRRHFIKESAMGFGALALGSFLGSCGNTASGNNIVFDPAHPLMPKLPAFPRQSKKCNLFTHGRCTFSIGII